MPCPRRESNHSDGITDQKSLQRTSATKSAQSGHPRALNQCPLLGVKRTSAVHFAGLDHQPAVRVTSSSSSSSGTKPLPPHVGHCCSSSVPFSTTPSPLQSGQVFKCASLWTP